MTLAVTFVSSAVTLTATVSKFGGYAVAFAATSTFLLMFALTFTITLVVTATCTIVL